MAVGAGAGALIMEACIWRWSISGDHSAPRLLLNSRHFLLSLGTSQPKSAKRSSKKRPKIRKLRRVVRVPPVNTHRMNKRLVLLVNADPETENVVRAGTSAGGQTLYIAEGCADAFRIAAKRIHHLALIILDLDRPGGGVPLLVAFEIAHLPTVTISNRREAVAVKHGALAGWSKPVSAERLKQALDYLAPVTAEGPLALAA